MGTSLLKEGRDKFCWYLEGTWGYLGILGGTCVLFRVVWMLGGTWQKAHFYLLSTSCGYMVSVYPELPLWGSNYECARTDTVFFPISEVSKGTVSLREFKG